MLPLQQFLWTLHLAYMFEPPVESNNEEIRLKIAHSDKLCAHVNSWQLFLTLHHPLSLTDENF